MQKLTKLIEECKNRNYNLSLTYQKMNDNSIEIYTGHKSNYRLLFYKDGFLKPKSAIKEGLKFLSTQD